MRVERLEWDSNFFGCCVGRLIVDAGQEIPQSLFDDFDLVYVVVEGELSPLQKQYFATQYFLADEKLTYEKAIHHAGNPNSNILSWPYNREVNKNLLDIAVQAGEFSRFRIDPKIPTAKFVELYEGWITNSVKRFLAEEVYYFSIDDQVAGVITLSIKNAKADIGILSVNRIFRGKGAATELVAAAEYWAKHIKGVPFIQVVTQASNHVACRFYEKNGFTIEKREYVFHWWAK